MPVRPAVRLAALALALAVPVLGAGCGGGAAVASSGQEAYERGMEAFERRRFARAIELFRQSLDFGRTGDTADDAQLYLARAYAGDRQYLLATSEYARFIGFYRTDPRLEDAQYERIQAYAALSPSFELDQTPTYEAIRYIGEFLRQYPDSERTADAATLLAELREKLARKQYEAARLYERRELYEAAVMAYGAVLADYPTSAFADDAAVGQLRAAVLYAEGSIAARQPDRFREALRLYERVVTLYPGSPFLREAEGHYDRAYRGLRATGADVPTATPTATPTAGRAD